MEAPDAPAPGQVPRLRVGDLDTLCRYDDALGGTLRVEVQVGDETFQIALIQSPSSPARV